VDGWTGGQWELGRPGFRSLASDVLPQHLRLCLSTCPPVHLSTGPPSSRPVRQANASPLRGVELPGADGTGPRTDGYLAFIER